MTTQTSPQLSAKSFAMLVTLAMVWGGSFFFAEIALEEVPPLSITLFRVGLAVPVLAVLILMWRIPVPRQPRVWAAYLVMGSLNNALPFSLIYWGQLQIESGLASILNGTTAVFGAVVAGLLLSDEPLVARKLIGALFGLFGVAVTLGFDLLAGFDPRDLAQIAVLGAALSYAFASVWAKTHLSDQRPEMNALGMLTGGTIVMIPVVLWFDGGVPSFRYSLPVWAALIGSALLSSVLAYLLYFAILRRAGAANLMLVTLMIPPFAIILGAAFLGERLAPTAFVGFALIALGLLITDGRVAKRFRRT